MEKIYIGLSTRTSSLSALIRWTEETEYSHVYIRRKSNNIGEYFYHAVGGGVNFIGKDLFLKDNIIVEEYEFELTREQLTSLLRFFVKNAGKKYSLKQLVILFGISLSEKFHIPCNLCKKIILDSNDEYICSELAAEVLCQYIVELQHLPSYDFITPKKLKPYLVKYGKKVV